LVEWMSMRIFVYLGTRMTQVRSRPGDAARRKKAWIATAPGLGFGLFVGYQVGERVAAKPDVMIALGAGFTGVGWAAGNALP
jgi:hypothetical protein